jgi:hypothetical protein
LRLENYGNLLARMPRGSRGNPHFLNFFFLFPIISQSELKTDGIFPVTAFNHWQEER